MAEKTKTKANAGTWVTALGFLIWFAHCARYLTTDQSDLPVDQRAQFLDTTFLVGFGLMILGAAIAGSIRQAQARKAAQENQQ